MLLSELQQTALHEEVEMTLCKDEQVGKTIKNPSISFGDKVHHIFGLAAEDYRSKMFLLRFLEDRREGLKKLLYIKRKASVVLALFL